MASLGKPNPVDVHVGSRVRMRRTLLGISQEKLGQALGLTFQQVQKYERGANRIGASRLFDLSRILEVQVNFFFEEMAQEVQEQSPGRLFEKEQEPEAYQIPDDPMNRRETLELVRAYYRIADPESRRRMFDLMRSIANAFDGEDMEQGCTRFPLDHESQKRQEVLPLGAFIRFTGQRFMSGCFVMERGVHGYVFEQA